MALPRTKLAFSPPDSPAYLVARKVAETLLAAGFETYFAGGCVRDGLLGLAPREYDVATAAPPEAVAALFPKSVAVGARFGVVRVLLDGGEVEVAAFRADDAYVDGRHPAGVRPASAREDVQRRDFTINGLLWDSGSGEVLDDVGGEADLAARLLRGIGDPFSRLREDLLRGLRGIRFAARFGLAIEPQTGEAIRQCAPETGKISAERIREELEKMLAGGRAGQAFRLLDQYGFLPVILPEVAAMKGVPQPPAFHPEGDVWQHTLILLERLPEGAPPALAWAALLHDVGKPRTITFEDRIRFNRHDEVGAEISREICKRLHASNHLTDAVAALVAEHQRFMNVPEMRESTLKRFVWQEHFDWHLELHRLDCLASHGDLSSYQHCLDKLREFGQPKPRLKPLVNGHDLIALGLKPGPRFKKLLDQVEDARLENRAATREEALALLQELASREE